MGFYGPVGCSNLVLLTPHGSDYVFLVRSAMTKWGFDVNSKSKIRSRFNVCSLYISGWIKAAVTFIIIYNRTVLYRVPSIVPSGYTTRHTDILHAPPHNSLLTGMFIDLMMYMLISERI